MPILLVLISFPPSGHAATLAPRWLTAPALLIHATVAMFWIGAFGPLLVRLSAGQPSPVVHRFSRIAAPAVLLLAVMGAVLAFAQVKPPLALVATPYGQLVSTKVLLFLSLLGLAAWNRMRLSAALTAEMPGATALHAARAGGRRAPASACGQSCG
jgi:copper transport protein